MVLEETSCCSCGIAFAVPAHYLAARRRDAESFHCPNGHSLSFRRSEADKLRDELSRARQEQERLAQAAAAEQKRAVAAEGALTRLRKRIAGGACPECNRTFADLRRHMHTKHVGKAEPAARPRLIAHAG